MYFHKVHDVNKNLHYHDDYTLLEEIYIPL
jgi:hypothetical protein